MEIGIGERMVFIWCLRLWRIGIVVEMRSLRGCLSLLRIGCIGKLG